MTPIIDPTHEMEKNDKIVKGKKIEQLKNKSCLGLHLIHSQESMETFMIPT
jgi:hypothetical protein